jgi:hypothetical protein
MFVGILLQGARYAVLERHTGAARDAGWEVVCDAEVGR